MKMLLQIKLFIIKLCLNLLYSNYSGFYPMVKKYNEYIEDIGLNEKWLIEY